MTAAEEAHLAIGAYVLHALAPEEEAAFENHLAGCDACTREVADLETTAARLAAAEAVTPPAALRQRVLERIAVTGQEQQFRRSRDPNPGTRWVLAACLAMAVALGATTVWQHEEANDARARAAEAETDAAALTDVLAAPDATIRAQQLGDGATARVVASRAQDRAVFSAAGLPRLTRGRVYELWYAEAGRLRPAGLLPGSGGHRTYVMDGELGDATGVGITVEPDGGSGRPTTRPLGLIPIQA
ncbi:anti-sigma factor [Streptomyces sp. NBC_00344]|uniref:anti-sigma factor n=1 Tax=Streptomyces sp. NBC_00344 TaxID=2975720 RepID=UPI002E1B5BDD